MVVTDDHVVLVSAHDFVQAQLRPVPVDAVLARGVTEDRALGQRAGPELLLPTRLAAVPRLEDLFLLVVEDRSPRPAVALPGHDFTQDGVVGMLLGGVEELPDVVQGLNVIQVHEELRSVADEGDGVSSRGRFRFQREP